jgi:hypothetical protein
LFRISNAPGDARIPFLEDRIGLFHSQGGNGASGYIHEIAFRGKDMQESSFETYKVRVIRAILKIDRKANLASLGETLIRHYFNAGYTERSAATAMIEVVTVQTPFRRSAYSLQRL